MAKATKSIIEQPKEEVVEIGQTSAVLTDDARLVEIPIKEAVELNLVKEEPMEQSMAIVPERDTPVVNTPKKKSIVGDINEQIEFLKRIYRIQNEGGFGVHLNAEILAQIDKLENK